MPKALLIDDEAALTTIIARYLLGAGFEVETATSGPEGIRKAVAAPPDVVVVDVMMPGMDGYEVCRRLRRDPRTTRTSIVVLTARGQLIDKEIALRAGADSHVSKPYQSKVLVEEIQRLLSSAPKMAPALGQQVLILRLQEDAGATTLAANLALSLRPGNRLVAAVDLEASEGPLETYLGLPPTRAWPADPAGSADLLASCLAWHESGIFVLPAPPPGSPPLQPGAVKEILSTLRAWHDYVVVDTPFNLGPLAPVLLSSSPIVLLVLAADPAVLRTAQASVAAVRKVAPHAQQIWPILGQARPEQESFAQQIEAVLKMPVIASLPWAPVEAAEARMNGRPIVLVHPDSPLAGAIRGVAQRIVQSTADQPLRRILR